MPQTIGGGTVSLPFVVLRIGENGVGVPCLPPGYTTILYSQTCSSSEILTLCKCSVPTLIILVDRARLTIRACDQVHVN